MADFRPIDLKCENLVTPLAVAERFPILSWQIETAGKDWVQSGYRIQVASNPNLIDEPDFWDSGPTASSEISASYNGAEIPFTEDAFWRVKVWDRNGAESEWSEIAEFARSLGGNWQWHAKWMSFPSSSDWSQPGPSPLFRRVFELPSNPIRKARLHFSAKGLIVPYLNGLEATDIVFSPGWADYHKRIQYDVEDVAHLLRPGTNVIGAMLGDGWYCGKVCWFGRNQYGERPAALLRLCVEFEDREPILIVSGQDGWKCAEGPIRSNDLLDGERREATYGQDGWLEPGFDDSGWTQPYVFSLGQVPLVPRVAQPVRRTETIESISIENRNGKQLVDFGQNIAGRVSVVVPANGEVEIRHGEILDANGDLYTENLRAAKATDSWQGGEFASRLEPLFTFHGFRYAEVKGLEGLDREECHAVVLHSDLRRTGWFESSNPNLNKLFENTVWSMRDNFLEIPTDCPQRDERLGWTGDAQVFATTAAYLFDVSAFIKKWMRDVADGASETGRFPNVAPQLQELGDGAPGWGDAGILVPMTMATFFGDERIVEENLPAMRRHMESILELNPDGLWRNGRSHDFGDWLAPFEETDKTFLASAFLVQMLRLLALHDPYESDRFDGLWWRSLESFRNEYVRDGRLTVETQTAYALAIAFKLGLPTDFPQYAWRLNELIESNGGKLGTGFLGVNHLLPSLAEFGYFDRCYDLLLRTDYPSWLYSVTKGATTIWERWDGWTEENGFQDVGMNSFNHYAYGSVVQWFFEHIGGIQPIEPAFKRFRLAPTPGGNLDFAKVRFDSRYGTIRSEWRLTQGGFEWELEIPPNTNAEIVLPPLGTHYWLIDGVRTKTRKERIYNSTRQGITLGSGAYKLKST